MRVVLIFLPVSTLISAPGAVVRGSENSPRTAFPAVAAVSIKRLESDPGWIWNFWSLHERADPHEEYADDSSIPKKPTSVPWNIYNNVAVSFCRWRLRHCVEHTWEPYLTCTRSAYARILIVKLSVTQRRQLRPEQMTSRFWPAELKILQLWWDFSRLMVWSEIRSLTLEDSYRR